MSIIIDEQFSELLNSNPSHWFAEINNGVRVMNQISYALYQAFCVRYGYKMGEFDLLPNKNRITGYIDHKDDWNILLPIYIREKNKYHENKNGY